MKDDLMMYIVTHMRSRTTVLARCSQERKESMGLGQESERQSERIMELTKATRWALSVKYFGVDVV